MVQRVHHLVGYGLNFVAAIAKVAPLQNGLVDDLPIYLFPCLIKNLI